MDNGERDLGSSWRESIQRISVLSVSTGSFHSEGGTGVLFHLRVHSIHSL